MYSSYGEETAQSFMRNLKQTVTKDFQIKCAQPKEVLIEGDDRKPRNWINKLEELQAEGELDIAIIIAPGRKGSSPIYDAVKLYSFTEAAIPTQFLLASTIESNQKSMRNISKKVMEQVVAKTGGTPWGFKSLPVFKEAPTMVVGLDVVHNVGKAKQSILTVAASMKKDCGNYFSTSIVVDRDPSVKAVKLSFDLEPIFQRAILKFKELNGDVEPQRIIVYRDSVSEGQNSTILAREVPAVRQALQSLHDGGELSDMPGLVFMTANKNVDQRFWNQGKSGAKNPQSGLVVKSHVTREDRFEFFMISHNGPTGLQAPVRYDVLA